MCPAKTPSASIPISRTSRYSRKASSAIAASRCWRWWGRATRWSRSLPQTFRSSGSRCPPSTASRRRWPTGAPAIHASKPDNILTSGIVECGDPAHARAEAAHTAEGTFETSFVEHAYIEPEAGFARRVGDRMEVYACTQAPMMDRDEVARVLGLPREGSASCPRPAAAASAASSTSRCSRCWRWQPGTSIAPCAASTSASSRWRPPPSGIPPASGRARAAMRQGAW